MTLYLFNFNNYYNRIVKKYDTIEEYGEPLFIIERVNFIPNNGISTEQIINYEGDHPDYLVLTDENDDIISRWFIIDSTRTRGGQFKLSLYRDVIADWYDTIIDSPCFVEKAILSNNDKMIFNNETMTYNQIKEKEIPLVDDSGCSWIVGYFNRNKYKPDEGANPEEINVDIPNEPYYDEVVNSSFDNWEYHDYFSRTSPYRVLNRDTIQYNSFFTIGNLQRSKYMTTNTKSYNECGISVFSGSLAFNILYTDSYGNTPLPSGVSSAEEFFMDKTKPYNLFTTADFGGDYLGDFDKIPRWSEADFTEVERLIKNSGTDIMFYDEYIKLKKYNNKVVKFNTGDPATIKYIKITVPEARYYGYSRYIPLSDALKATLGSIQAKYYIKGINLANRSSFLLTDLYTEANPCKYDVVNYSRFITSFPAARNHPDDAPYDVFCIPYNKPENADYTVEINGNPLNPSMTLLIAQEIIRKYAGSNYVYDVQLLPYFPMSYLVSKTLNTITIEPGDNKTSTPIMDENDVEKGRIYFLNKTSFTNIIPFNYQIKNVKISSETEFMRLVSPNYNGQFEFSPAKNNGIESFNIDCTYKPYNPYIHINPNFNYLYGSDFNDSRGLICGGDFSLTLMNDAWETYQIQNKNYLNIFDRQIQNMNVNNDVQRALEKWNVATGGLSGTVSGGMTGGMIGGVPGAIAGAVAGGAASIGGGIADIYYNEQLRTEAINYTQDLFGYNMGNIQALPQSISKTSAFTYNNKIFPILEIFGCTEIERKALASKICYNSMTVMRIGTIAEFLNNSWSWTAEDGTQYKSKGYIKGQLIRLENITENFHIINQISNELYKGVYL